MNTLRVNDREFSIVKLLGKGKGGYSYLASDGSKSFVVKKIHHEPCDYYTFGNKIESELNDYRRLKLTGIRLPEMLDIDIENETILKEYIEGDTVYHMVKNDLDVGFCIEQIEMMCKKLYPNGLNIDYFPTNFVVSQGLVYYIDYECNGYMDEWNFENWGKLYYSKTPQFMEYMKNHPDL